MLLKKSPKLSSTKLKPELLSKFMVEFYKMAQQKFSVDEQRHYLFTPRNLTQIIFNLLGYDSERDKLSLDLVYEMLSNEVKKEFRDRLVSQK